MKVYFIRHGEAEHNVAKVLCGQKDTLLTQNGRAQAQEGAIKVGRLGIDIMYASPLLRAKETAEIIGRKTGIDIVFDDRLKERRGGILEGTPKGDFGISGVPDDTPGVETIDELRSRMRSFIEHLTQRDPDKTVLIVGHGGSMKMMLSLLNE